MLNAGRNAKCKASAQENGSWAKCTTVIVTVTYPNLMFMKAILVFTLQICTMGLDPKTGVQKWVHLDANYKATAEPNPHDHRLNDVQGRKGGQQLPLHCLNTKIARCLALDWRRCIEEFDVTGGKTS